MKLMTRNASSYEQVIQALPAVTEAVRVEIAKHEAAGEMIAYIEGDHVVASRPATRDLAARRKELLDEFSGKSQAAPKAMSAA